MFTVKEKTTTLKVTSVSNPKEPAYVQLAIDEEGESYSCIRLTPAQSMKLVTHIIKTVWNTDED